MKKIKTNKIDGGKIEKKCIHSESISDTVEQKISTLSLFQIDNSICDDFSYITINF